MFWDDDTPLGQRVQPLFTLKTAWLLVVRWRQVVFLAIVDRVSKLTVYERIGGRGDEREYASGGIPWLGCG